MPLNNSTQSIYFVRILNALQLHQFSIAAIRKNSRHIQYICNASRHPSAKVLSSLAQYDHYTASHILASMSTNTFHNGQRISGSVTLAPGDSVQVGPVVFVLQVDGNDFVEDVYFKAS